MQKGERRRAELLWWAQKLFSSQGYQGTSINDILKQAGGSKGSFYHHFLSKRQVVQELGDQRATRSYDAYKERTNQDGLARLNNLLYYACPVRQGEEAFLASLLSMGDAEEEAIAQKYLCRSVSHVFYPQYLQVLMSLREAGMVGRYDAALAGLLWESHMALGFSLLAIAAAQQGSNGLAAQNIVALLRAQRLQWERMLDIPFGSLTLLDAGEAMEALAGAMKMLGDAGEADSVPAQNP